MSEQKSESKVAEQASKIVETVEKYDSGTVMVTKSWHDGIGDFEGQEMVRFNVVFDSLWYYSEYDGEMDQVLYKTNPVMPGTDAEHFSRTEADAYARGFADNFDYSEVYKNE